MLVLQMLSREKSRNLLIQKQGKEEMSVNHMFQEFVRKLFHTSSRLRRPSRFKDFVLLLKDWKTFSCVSKDFVNDFYLRGKDCAPCLVQRLYASVRIIILLFVVFFCWILPFAELHCCRDRIISLFSKERRDCSVLAWVIIGMSLLLSMFIRCSVGLREYCILVKVVNLGQFIQVVYYVTVCEMI